MDNYPNNQQQIILPEEEGIRMINWGTGELTQQAPSNSSFVPCWRIE